ncbi:MAG: hypothetical protein K8H88_29480 [Sandaracinaceae bacterium]|nr:hypothetical protein [Sandaracinaceae bacterium]
MSKVAPFLGRWVLSPSRSRYEHGPVPRAATYAIEGDDTQLRFTIDWTPAQGETLHVTQALWFPVPTKVDDAEVTMRLIDARTLETIVREDEREVARATRVVSEDGRELEVTQSGEMGDDERFENVSVYTRAG